jgi:hypothetical protein
MGFVYAASAHRRGNSGHRPRSKKLTKWLASPASPFVDDFVRLYNPNALPVNLGGLFLTDQPIGAPFRHEIAPLSFIDGFGYLAFIADGNKSAGPDHVDFSLSAEVGEIALFSGAGGLIDCVTYGQQFAGISQGRSPNGGSRIVYFDVPTPGAGNPVAPAPVQPQTVNLLPLNDTFLWKYEDTGADLGTGWRATGFNDSAWPSGAALLAVENAALPEPIRTPLALLAGKITFYFRAHFNLPPGLNISGLQVTHVIDDGAVFYLNGQEARRYGMPNGLVDFTTLATLGVGDATYQGPFDLPLSMSSWAIMSSPSKCIKAAPAAAASFLACASTPSLSRTTPVWLASRSTKCWPTPAKPPTPTAPPPTGWSSTIRRTVRLISRA